VAARCPGQTASVAFSHAAQATPSPRPRRSKSIVGRTAGGCRIDSTDTLEMAGRSMRGSGVTCHAWSWRSLDGTTGSGRLGQESSRGCRFSGIAYSSDLRPPARARAGDARAHGQRIGRSYPRESRAVLDVASQPQDHGRADPDPTPEDQHEACAIVSPGLVSATL
jgi:hypothetical protein